VVNANNYKRKDQDNLLIKIQEIKLLLLHMVSSLAVDITIFGPAIGAILLECMKSHPQF